MGEWSKRIGENGEAIVERFLKEIGWVDPMKGVVVPSINPEKHQRKGSKNVRSTHGIDFYYHYRSALINNTLEHIAISSKFSSNPYPSSPGAIFREHITDLAWAIESFKHSEVLRETTMSLQAVENIFTRGVLFWINNDFEGIDDVISEVSGVNLPADLVHDGIFLVDNKRLGFIYESIRFAKTKFRQSRVEFIYFNTGMNHDSTLPKSGDVLPVQYINSSILPLRIQESNDVTHCMICVLDKFDKDILLRTMGLAKSIGTNLQGKTMVCFPDYNFTQHENAVAQVKGRFEDPVFSRNVSVHNYFGDIRS